MAGVGWDDMVVNDNVASIYIKRTDSIDLILSMSFAPHKTPFLVAL